MNCLYCQKSLPADDVPQCPYCGRQLNSAVVSRATADESILIDSKESISDIPADEQRPGTAEMDSADRAAQDSYADATFVSDEWAEHDAPVVERTIQFEKPESIEASDSTYELPVREDGDDVQDDVSSYQKTIQSEDFSDDSSDSFFQEEFGTKELPDRTIVSEDFSDSVSDVSDDSFDLNLSQKTIASHFHDNDDADRTMVSEEFLNESLPEGPDEKFASPQEMKTLESNWGSEGSNLPPRMTIKSRGEVSFDGSGGGYGETATSVPFRTLRTTTDSPRQPKEELAEYELIKVLGEGGMGIVWSARQTSVDRHVAVKMIKGAMASKRSQRQKFLAEAIVTGDLDHPNIVPIYDVGTDSVGSLFYAMKQVKGTPWLKVIKEKSLFENLEILLRTADAIAFAHSRNIIHRDLKPENVMLGDFGEVLVMDWGLALALGDLDKARHLRKSTSMGGTPAYMAPEMATGPIDRITTQSDIYLLGAILWEILTGRPPHPGKKVQQCLLAAMRNQIVPTEKTGELVAIAMKAMATNPRHRYATVVEFQQAIRESLSHSESVTMADRAAHDLTIAQQSDDYKDYAKAVFGFEEAYDLWKGNDDAHKGIHDARVAYAQSALRKGDYDLGTSLLDPDQPEHNELLARLQEARQERETRQQRLMIAKRIMTGMLACILLVVSVAFFWIRSERNYALEQKDLADQARVVAEASERVAVDARKHEETAKIQALAAKQEEERAKLDALAAQELEAEARLKAEEAQKAEQYEAYIARIGLAAAKIEENAFDVAIELLDQCSPHLRNWEWGRLMHLCRQASEIYHANGPIDAVAFSPDGTRFITGTWDHQATVWDLATQKILFTLPQKGLYVHSVAWSPDQKWIVTAGNDPEGRIKIWNASQGELVAQVNGHIDAVVSATFSPDGNWLLTSSYDQTARLWDVSEKSSPQEVYSFEGHSWWVWNARFSPGFNLDDRSLQNRVVTVSQDGKAIIWTLVQRDPDAEQALTGSDLSLFEKGGKQFALEVHEDGVFAGHEGPVYTVSFSPDGQHVASAGYDKRILVWKPDEVPPYDLNTVLSGQKQEYKFRELIGHTAPVQSVTFSKDGRLIVSGSRDNAVKAWSAETGKAIKTFRGHHSGVRSVSVAPDGRSILSGGQDQRAIVWSIDDYEEIRVLTGRQLTGHEDAILNAGFSGDGSTILTASRDRTARTWDARTGRMLRTFTEGHDYLVSRGTLFPDGRILATAAADNTVRLWNVTTGTQFLRLEQTGRSAVLALSPDGRWLVTGNDHENNQTVHGTVKLWKVSELLSHFVDPDDEDSPEQKLTPQILNGHHARVTAAQFSPTTGHLLTCDANGRCQLRDVDTGEILWNVKHHTARVNLCEFLPDGSTILTASADHTVSRLDAETGEEIPSLILKHTHAVAAMTVSADGRRIITVEDTQSEEGQRAGLVHLWDAQSGQKIQTSRIQRFGISHVTYIPGSQFALAVCTDNVLRRFAAMDHLDPIERDDRWMNFHSLGGHVGFASATNDGESLLTVGGSEARFWELATRREKMTFSPHGAVAAASFSPDGTHIITGSWDNSAKIWNAKTAQAVRRLEQGHSGYINSVAYSPDGQFVLTASDDGTAKLWNAETAQIVRVYPGHTGRVRQAAFSPNGNRILTVSSDRTARIWNRETGEQIGPTLTGHRWSLLCGIFSPDGKRILTGSEDNDARLWDVESGELIAVFQGHTASITSVVFSADGKRAFTASQDNTAKLWDVTPGREGNEVLTLSGHSQELTSIAVSPNGREILTASRDGTAVMWLTSDWTPAESVSQSESSR